MTLKPVFNNPDNWEPIGSVVGQELMNADGTAIPMSPLIFPLIIYQSTLAISCVHYPDPPSSWNYAGKASLRIQTGIITGANIDSSIGSKKLFFGQNNICVFPNFANSYGLVFYVPKWFAQIEYTVFGYVGPGYADVETKLNRIYEEVNL